MDPYSNPSQPSYSTPDTNNWRLYLELLALTGFVFPFGQILGPLVLWLIKKDTSSQVSEEGKKVINYHMSWTIWGLLSCGLGFLPWIIITLVSIIKAGNNQPFNHPLTISFLK
jgi:uncharacterized Tic20 family protein